MALPYSSWRDPRGFFCRERWSVSADPTDEGREGVATAANSSGIWTTGWDLLRADSLVDGAVGFAEQRMRLADVIVVDLMIRPDVRDAPEAIQNFFLRVWPLVIAHVQLTDEILSDDVGACVSLIDEVLWSVHRDSTLRRPAELFHLIPGMLQRLRRGVALLGDAPPEAEPFFAALERLHRPVLKLCTVRRRDAQPEAVATATRPFESNSVWNALRPGIWVDLYSAQGWVRARLDWVDPQGRQFLFKSRHGRAHAMTRRILERLVREQLLRLTKPSSAARKA